MTDEHRMELGRAIRRALEHHQSGRLREAEALYRRVLERDPNQPDALHYLGVIAHQVGDHESAIQLIGRAIAGRPRLPHPYNNLGEAYRALGRTGEAIACYQEALAIDPGFHDARYSLALLSMEVERFHDAALHLRHLLDVRNESIDRMAMGRLLESGAFEEVDDRLLADLLRAIAEQWGSPSRLALRAVSLLESDPLFQRFNSTWEGGDAIPDSARRLLEEDAGFRRYLHAPLFLTVLGASPVASSAMERFLMRVRRILLEKVTTDGAEGQGALNTEEWLPFVSALAFQGFLNEYVSGYAEEETGRVSALKERLAARRREGRNVPALWLAMLASYVPLNRLPAAAELLAMDWPEPVAEVVTQQIREPLEEKQIAAQLPRLTPIDDPVSLAVRAQYEENPYPRWRHGQESAPPQPIDQILAATFPEVQISRSPVDGPTEILIAGCGTGYQPLMEAQCFADARLLAVDLSLASLAYAVRKSRELGIGADRVEFAQADVLRLGDLGRRFHVIQASGVLHHMADPLAGWRILAELLHPAGLLFIGLYSQEARRHETAASRWIVEKGFPATAAGIRAARREILALPENHDLRSCTRAPDFFSLSECRDLLFHVQEHLFTLPQIAAALEALKLRLLGFILGAEVKRRYRTRFPADTTLTDLDSWHRFEEECPDTFAGMYQFWVQKID